MEISALQIRIPFELIPVPGSQRDRRHQVHGQTRKAEHQHPTRLDRQRCLEAVNGLPYDPPCQSQQHPRAQQGIDHFQPMPPIGELLTRLPLVRHHKAGEAQQVSNQIIEILKTV